LICPILIKGEDMKTDPPGGPEGPKGPQDLGPPKKPGKIPKSRFQKIGDTVFISETGRVKK